MKKIENVFKLSLFLVFIFGIAGCVDNAYLGMRGAPIQLHPEVHSRDITTDKQCLGCHHPDIAEAPITPHPEFKGCLKCHSDEIE
jgi:hypothetical protein